MTTYRFLFLILLFTQLTTSAQNLVPNPGFEKVLNYNFSGVFWNDKFNEPYTPISYCLQNYNDYLLHENCTYTHKLLYWNTRSFNFRTINLKAYQQTEEGYKPIIYDLPQEQPLEGDGAFNIISYTQYSGYKNATKNPINEYYGYLDNTLKSPLETGKKYYVEFYVKFYIYGSDLLQYYPSEIGLLFSDDLRPFTKQEINSLKNSGLYLVEVLSRQTNRPASVSSLPNRFYGVNQEWQRVCGFYTAKGGEQYISIGNFNQNELWYYSPEYGVIDIRDFPYELNDRAEIYSALMIDNVRIEEYKPGMFFEESQSGEIKVCESELPYQLSLADSFNTYSWQNGSQEKTLPITEAGKYQVELDAFGCYITDSVEVVVEQTLQVDIKDTLICPQQLPYPVYSHVNTTINWSNGSTNPQTQYNQSGTHWVILENSCGTQTDTFQIAVIDTSEFQIPISKKLLFCENTEIDTLFKIPNYFQNVTWKDGDTTHNKRFNDTVTFSVNLTNRCIDTTYYFSLEYFPEDLSLSDTFSCEGIPLHLPVSKNYTTYQWNTGDTTATISALTSGIYTLTVETPCGQWSDSLHITYIPLQPKTIQDDTLICRKGVPNPITYSLSYTNWDSIQWYTGSRDSSITITQQGEIYVIAKNRCQTRIDTAKIVDCATDLDYSINAPNIITPNGDNKNECFKLEYYNISIEELSIYSRYGVLTAQLKSDNWCPQSNIPSGMYYYLLTFKTPYNTTEYLKGWVMVQE